MNKRKYTEKHKKQTTENGQPRKEKPWSNVQRTWSGFWLLTKQLTNPASSQLANYAFLEQLTDGQPWANFSRPILSYS